MAADGQEAQTPFIKNLASSDRKLRESSLASLRTFLSSQHALPLLPAQKLWKGLYYALYMTDRPIPQARFATDLASLLPPTAEARRNWYAAFWSVLGERWPHVDALRMDKFMLLVRRVLAAQLGVAAGGVAGVEVVLGEYPFEADGDLKTCPLGLRLHVLDIWVDELEKAGLLGEEHEAFARRVADAVEALRTCRVKQVRIRAGESLADSRLPWNDDVDEEEEGEDEEWGGIDD